MPVLSPHLPPKWTENRLAKPCRCIRRFRTDDWTAVSPFRSIQLNASGRSQPGLLRPTPAHVAHHMLAETGPLALTWLWSTRGSRSWHEITRNQTDRIRRTLVRG